jgi:sarcosine oxidase subunit alpha
MKVERQGGWPSLERDLLSIADRLHPLMPVGFYHKAFVHPRLSWRLAEKVIRRATGVGGLLTDSPGESAPAQHLRCDVLVVGAGPAGLAAAREAAGGGARVILCDEGDFDAEVVGEGVTSLGGFAAIGVYEGPVVPLVGDDTLLQVHPGRIVVATGATEAHPVFPGNDLPGVMLGRAAAHLAQTEALHTWDRAVVAVRAEEGLGHLESLQRVGVRTLALVPSEFARRVPTGVQTIIDGEVVGAEGRSRVTSALVRSEGVDRRAQCDLLVLSVGLAARDSLIRTAWKGERVEAVGDAALRWEPGPAPRDGVVCLCEDVSLRDLERARDEGFRSAEMLKRYTSATMGPCQGAMCGRHLAAFAGTTEGDGSPQRTTARPPVRPVSLAALASGTNEIVERRTGLHETHLAVGARMGWSGPWMRPFSYGDWRDEYQAVRQAVSVMDVGTLGKFLIAGPDAAALVDAVLASTVRDLSPGRTRYCLALDEGGYVADDCVLSALESNRWYLTSTSSGADAMEARLKNWAELLSLQARVLNQTAQLGAIVVAGPRSRELLQRLGEAEMLQADAFPYGEHREVLISDVPCRAIRVGFVGELAFELHHPRSRGRDLWDALIREGGDLGIRPHGLDALELLRLEKGHIYLGQDSLPDDTPEKLGLGWAVGKDKEWFVGKPALERLAARPLERKLVGLRFDSGGSELRGMPLGLDGGMIGRVTSAERSDTLGASIGLGWVRATDGQFPSRLEVGGSVATVVDTPFYDPHGSRMRA